MRVIIFALLLLGRQWLLMMFHYAVFAFSRLALRLYLSATLFRERKDDQCSWHLCVHRLCTEYIDIFVFVGFVLLQPKAIRCHTDNWLPRQISFLQHSVMLTPQIAGSQWHLN